jgi:Asp-tRNA(Asn)/Glu-tRNA(Gln) amidotransferase A subunit family amidase
MQDMVNHTTAPIERRGFLALLSAAALTNVEGESHATALPQEDVPDPCSSGSITQTTIMEAEKLAGVHFTSSERAMMVSSIGAQIASFQERLEKSDLTNNVAPATTFNPVVQNYPPRQVTTGGILGDIVVTLKTIPENETEIAFASVANLSHWIHTRQISCDKLTRLYIKRLKQFGKQLLCTITLTDQHALEQAKLLDQELAQGQSRGILHGIPWGAKDLFDTKGIRTTFGAATFKDRVPNGDAEVVRRLEKAGAILVAKLSLGALAYGDVWFGGKTRTPWDLGKGASGSSAGSAAATAAGLVGFSLGSETSGSIVSPCQQCGAFGLRPTFGRVPRDGAMTLCWSLDKVGPICRNANDLGIVLAAIHGASPMDPSSVTKPFHSGIGMSTQGLTVGVDPKWFNGHEDSKLFLAAQHALEASGVTVKRIEMPDLPWHALYGILTSEATAAFETLTRDDADDQLTWQAPEAWPNTFRQSWFIPAPEYVQLQRFRRQVMDVYARIMDTVDAIMTPPFAGGTLISTNCTGHPAIACPIGTGKDKLPRVLVLIGHLYDEGTLLRLGHQLQSKTWAHQRPLVGNA